MSEEKPAYLTPAVLIGDSAALFADVRRKYREGLPGTLQAAKWFRLEDVLNHAEAALAASQRLAEATRELEYERQMRAETEKAMSTLAGRVKEQQAELAEQEAGKLELIRQIFTSAK